MQIQMPTSVEDAHHRRVQRVDEDKLRKLDQSAGHCAAILELKNHDVFTNDVHLFFRGKTCIRFPAFFDKVKTG